MNKKILSLIVFLIYNTIFCENKQPHIITFFIKPLDKAREKELEKEKLKNINQARAMEKNFIDLISSLGYYNLSWKSGIYATYAGAATYSDYNGQIIFERKSIKPKFNLLLIENIIPILKPAYNKGNKNIYAINTILGFTLPKKADFKYYLIEKVENFEKKLYSWKINEQTILREKIIPYETIIIFANPKDIFIPIGEVHTISGENLRLPDIYFVNKLDRDIESIRFLNIRKYFSNITKEFEFKPDLYQQRIKID